MTIPCLDSFCCCWVLTTITRPDLCMGLQRIVFTSGEVSILFEVIKSLLNGDRDLAIPVCLAVQIAILTVFWLA